MSTYYVGDIPFSDELYHYGIKGQKWGIRRYQNLDRTLTSEGKERYRHQHGYEGTKGDSVSKKNSAMKNAMRKIPMKVGRYVVKEALLLALPISSPVARVAIAVGVEAAPALIELYKDYKLRKDDFE